MLGCEVMDGGGNMRGHGASMCPIPCGENTNYMGMDRGDGGKRRGNLVLIITLLRRDMAWF